MSPRIVPIAAVAALLAGMLLATAVNAMVRHTQELPASFVAVAPQGSDGSTTQQLQLASLDLDADGYIGAADLMYAMEALGPTQEQWSPEDVNRDGHVDVLDLAAIALSYGSGVPP